MSFTFADFKLRFPELAGVDELFYNQAKASAELSVNQNVWDLKTDEGVKLMTAHILSLSNRGGITGQVKRLRVGDLEKEYDNFTSSDSASTSYLSAFNRMMKSLNASPIFIC